MQNKKDCTQCNKYRDIISEIVIDSQEIQKTIALVRITSLIAGVFIGWSVVIIVLLLNS